MSRSVTPLRCRGRHERAEPGSGGYQAADPGYTRNFSRDSFTYGLFARRSRGSSHAGRFLATVIGIFDAHRAQDQVIRAMTNQAESDLQTIWRDQEDDNARSGRTADDLALS